MSRIQNNLFGTTEFVHRCKDLGSENLKFIFSIIKSISLGAATIVIFKIIFDKGSPDSVMSWPDFALRVSFWIISSMALLLTYNGAMLGTLFLVHIPKNPETVLTFSLAAFEFLLFAILAANFFDEKNNIRKIFNVQILNCWFLFFSIYCFCANRILKNALSNIKEESFTQELMHFVRQYKESLKVEVKYSGITAIISLIAFVCSCLVSCQILDIRFLFAVPLFISLLFSLLAQKKQRLKVEEFVQNLKI